MHERLPEIREERTLLGRELEQLDSIGGALGLGRGDMWDLAELERKLEAKQWEQRRIDVAIADVKRVLNNVGEAAMRKDCSPYLAFQAYGSLGATEKILARVKKGARTARGEFDYDLLRAVLDYGSEEQAEEALREYIPATNAHWLDLLEDQTGYFQRRLEVVRTSYNRFAVANRLQPFPRGGKIHAGFTSTQLLNSACELKKKNYDLAIGVLKSGERVAGLLDYLGQNTRYVEWHRNWKRGPVWRSIGSNSSPVLSAKRILLLEQDTHTGKTLHTLAPFLDKLNPEIVDVSFWIDEHKTNNQIVRGSGFYSESLLVRDTPLRTLITNLNETVAYAETKNKEIPN